ncbi:S1 RNA-binding domain-containing protein [Schnuerera sp. xch1]|uniref:CvfB family protein n=1 Tax=Schnuerera sp. xch1 TaxID=2874283 RepID=UPI001CBC2731|nr:S1-like domain-containing RNA-binding protein [Schnuerera sp. xch1]MBZ2174424.1 S1 RNA-binding domain-containing protein [Schnuerera sp. xch1]
MINLGEMQKLEVKREASIGVFLNTKEENRRGGEDVLLPKKEVPEGTKIGDTLEVFIYKDSEDRLIATTKKTKVTLGEIGLLRVVDITRIGAFLDWGLEKDLFLPFKEQTMRLEKGKEYLIGLYIDKSDRLCATMKIRDFLRTDSPYKRNDWVKGIIYSINDEIGAFVAVDNKYEGLIPKKELIGVYEPGEEVDLRIIKVKEDGKLDLSLRDKAYLQIDKDAEIILKKLKENGGMLVLNDHSSPKRIRRELNMSKSAFKKAVGRLLKERKIKFIEGGIKLS